MLKGDNLSEEHVESVDFNFARADTDERLLATMEARIDEEGGFDKRNNEIINLSGEWLTDAYLSEVTRRADLSLRVLLRPLQTCFKLVSRHKGPCLPLGRKIKNLFIKLKMLFILYPQFY